MQIKSIEASKRAATTKLRDNLKKISMHASLILL